MEDDISGEKPEPEKILIIIFFLRLADIYKRRELFQRFNVN